MLTLIEKLEDYANLVTEIQDLVTRVGFKNDQLICQGRSSDTEDWHLGIGSINDLEHKDEDSYNNIFPSLENTTIAKYIKRYNGFRSRIMNITPRHCYTIHRDPTPRVHIPIVTNRDCWMVWPYSKEIQHMPVGYSYWTDTRKHHTFLNGGQANRIHLVICISATDPKNVIANP
jgi:hypothetical protein